MHTPHGNRMGEFNILNALVVRNRHVLLRCVDLHTNPQVEPGRGKSHGGRPRFSKKPQRPRRRPLSRTGNQNAGGGGYLALRNSRETKPDQRRFPRGGLRENRVLLSVPPLPHTGARAAAGFLSAATSVSKYSALYANACHRECQNLSMSLSLFP